MASGCSSDSSPMQSSSNTYAGSSTNSVSCDVVPMKSYPVHHPSPPVFEMRNLNVKFTCRYPQYMHEEKRWASFHDWPQSNYITPAPLVKAGFFYESKPEQPDRARCFQCGVAFVLIKWKSEDKPLEQHLNSQCKYAEQLRAKLKRPETASGETEHVNMSPVPGTARPSTTREENTDFDIDSNDSFEPELYEEDIIELDERI